MRFFNRKNVVGRLIPLLFILTILVFVYSFFSPSLPRIRPSLAPIKDELVLLLSVLTLGFIILKRQKWPAVFSDRAKIHVFYFSVMFLLVLLSRLPYLIYHLTLLNADKSVTLLMVKNIAQGASFPIYFYGQFYQGSLPAYVYAFLYTLLPQLNLSVLVVNFFVYALFILFAALLIGKVTNRKSLFYPIIILCLPLAGMNLFSNDMVRGIPFIVFFEFLLLYLAYQVIFEKKKYYFLAGVVGGLLYWLYLPSISFILIVSGWICGFLLVQKKVRLILRASVSFIVGFCVGNFPHILAEINNDFINTKFLLFSPRSLGKTRIFDLDSLTKIFEAVFIDLDMSRVVSSVIFLLFVCGSGYVLFCFLREKNVKKIYLLVSFLASLVLLFLSGYPPTPRYLIHYRLYSLFTLVIIIQVLQEMRIFHAKGTKVFFLLIFAGLSIWKAGIRFPELREIHTRNKLEIAALDKTEQKVYLGNYWDVMRLAPFMEREKLFITAPTASHPQGMFTFSKYYPAALKLGDLWNRTSKALFMPTSKSESLEQLLRDFGITYNRADLPSGKYALYSDFSMDLSPSFIEFMGSNLRQKYLATERNAALYIKERLADIPEPHILDSLITVSNPFMDELPNQEWGEKELKGWRCVLKKGNHHISFPLDFSGESTTFALPDPLAFEEGIYKKYIYYLNTPVYSCGSINIPVDTQDKLLILSDMKDSLLFTPMRDEKRKNVRGLPLEQLELKVLDPSFHTLECEVYSFFNFDSTIWTNRYDQVVYVNDKEYVLAPGKNKLAIPIIEEKTLRFDTKYKSLLLARDSRGNIIFPNTGVVLERIKVLRDDSSVLVVPFLKQSPED